MVTGMLENIYLFFILPCILFDLQQISIFVVLISRMKRRKQFEMFISNLRLVKSYVYIYILIASHTYIYARQK